MSLRITARQPLHLGSLQEKRQGKCSIVQRLRRAVQDARRPLRLIWAEYDGRGRPRGGEQVVFPQRREIDDSVNVVLAKEAPPEFCVWTLAIK